MLSFSNVYSTSFRSYVSSYAAYFRETVGIELEESQALCKEATQLEIKEDEHVTCFLQKAFAHLANNPCQKLEEILQDKLSKLPLTATIGILKKIDYFFTL